MSYSIFWSPDAAESFEKRIDYLREHWTDREIKNFIARVSIYLKNLQEEPFIGKQTGKRKNVRTGLVIKEVSIIYRVHPANKEVELVLFIDNRQNPRKIKKYTP